MDAIIKSRTCVLITTAFCSIFYASRVEASTETYLGCYHEYGAEAVFVIPSSNKFNGSTPDGCREGCRKDLIYSFAGLWGGTTCYCASGLNEKLIKQVNNSICYRPCPIEPAEFCGGSNASYTFSVYSVCPRGFYGRDCTNECNCRDNKNCTLQGVCPGNECAAGWNLNSTIPNRPRCSIEIDECAVNTTNCEHACINMHGSYYCICQPGYKLHHDRHSCVDVDECEIPCSSLKTTQCYQCKEFNECQNTIGSFTCRCKSGYTFDLQQDTCEDIDECSRQMANCSHTCTNTNGSYECGCFEGFELEDGSHRCVVLESGLWALVAGLGLGAGVLFIVVVALAITVCQLLSARNLKVTGKEAEKESFAKMSRQNEYAQLANQQATPFTTST